MYQVLARKYRPRTFSQLVGQSHVSKALTSALERNRLHHAYLFTGTRGVGKTTIARILSKCLNCETGITATPCEVCATCVAINDGRFIDLIEIDAASRTKVEDTRELLDNVPYAPTQGRYKVYLIDEVHMLSTHSFNALLKTLEEPPEHVKFLLATTDPQKLPITVVSRCLQFTLRPLQQQEIHDHLQHVLSLEHITADDKALWQLSEAAQGSVRDALSLTDQAIAYGQGELHGNDVQEMLGLLDKGQLLQLLQAIHANHSAQVSQILQNLANQAVDLKAVLDQLITLLHQVALLQVLPEVPLQGTDEYQQHLHKLAQVIDRSDVQLYYQIGLQGRQDLKLAVSLQQGFDMCILRMLAFKPLAPNAQAENIPEISASAQNPAIPNSVNTFNSSVANVTVNPSVAKLEAENTPFQVDENSKHNTVSHTASAFSNDHVITDMQPITQINPLTTVETIPDLSNDSVLLPEPEPDLTFEPENNLIADEPADLFVESVEAEESDFIEPQIVIDISLNQSAIKPLTEISSSNPADLSLKTPLEQAVIAVPDLSIEDTNLPDQRLPQQILQHQKVALEGQWNLEKWEYWLREADISPAILNLAQHGVMQGEIGQHSTFMIAPEHRLMATELIDGLVAAFKTQWPNSKLEMQLVKTDGLIPLQLKIERQQKAQQQAEKLLTQEPFIKTLIQQFDATLSNVVLKP